MVPSLRFLSTVACASSQPTKAFASVTCVVASSDWYSGFTTSRVAWSAKVGYAQSSTTGLVPVFFACPVQASV